MREHISLSVENEQSVTTKVLASNWRSKLLKFRSILAPWKHLIVRIPLYLKYWTRVFSEQSIDSQISALPLPPFPSIYWIKITDLDYNGYMEQGFQDGHFCSGVTWVFPKEQPRTSVFEQVSPETYRYERHETIRRMFIHGEHYKNTPEYEEIMQSLKEKPGSSVRGCRNPRDVENLFAGLRTTYQTMKTDGFLTQKELGFYNYDEISIYLTKDGKLLKGGGGSHRILIAELVGLESVAAVLRGIHKDFVKQLVLNSGKHPMEAIQEYLRNDPRFCCKRPKSTHS